MSILNDSEIEELVRKGKLISSSYRAENLTPNGYDLTINTIRLDGQEEEVEEATVKPFSMFWVSTSETVDMPPDVGGKLWIRSSYARKGVFGSFGFVDAGFRGTLTLAFFNGSSKEVIITRGKTIAQLTFIRMGGKAGMTYGERSGNYQDQSGLKL